MTIETGVKVVLALSGTKTDKCLVVNQSPKFMSKKTNLYMAQQIVLLQVALLSGHVGTQLAEKGFSPVWIIGVCSFRLYFRQVMLPQNLQIRTSPLYGTVEYAL